MKYILDRLWLLPEYQSRGIGSDFIEKLAARADSRQVPIRLTVLRVNRARRLYERFGFVFLMSPRHTYRCAVQLTPNELLERTALKLPIFAYAKIRPLQVSRSTRC